MVRRLASSSSHLVSSGSPSAQTSGASGATYFQDERLSFQPVAAASPAVSTPSVGEVGSENAYHAADATVAFASSRGKRQPRVDALRVPDTEASAAAAAAVITAAAECAARGGRPSLRAVASSLDGPGGRPTSASFPLPSEPSDCSQGEALKHEERKEPLCAREQDSASCNAFLAYERGRRGRSGPRLCEGLRTLSPQLRLVQTERRVKGNVLSENEEAVPSAKSPLAPPLGRRRRCTPPSLQLSRNLIPQPFDSAAVQTLPRDAQAFQQERSAELRSTPLASSAATTAPPAQGAARPERRSAATAVRSLQPLAHAFLLVGSPLATPVGPDCIQVPNATQSGGAAAAACTFGNCAVAVDAQVPLAEKEAQTPRVQVLWYCACRRIPCVTEAEAAAVVSSALSKEGFGPADGNGLSPKDWRLPLASASAEGEGALLFLASSSTPLEQTDSPPSRRPGQPQTPTDAEPSSPRRCSSCSLFEAAGRRPLWWHRKRRAASCLERRRRCSHKGDDLKHKGEWRGDSSASASAFSAALSPTCASSPFLSETRPFAAPPAASAESPLACDGRSGRTRQAERSLAADSSQVPGETADDSQALAGECCYGAGCEAVAAGFPRCTRQDVEEEEGWERGSCVCLRCSADGGASIFAFSAKGGLLRRTHNPPFSRQATAAAPEPAPECLDAEDEGGERKKESGKERAAQQSDWRSSSSSSVSPKASPPPFVEHFCFPQGTAATLPPAAGVHCAQSENSKAADKTGPAFSLGTPPSQQRQVAGLSNSPLEEEGLALGRNAETRAGGSGECCNPWARNSAVEDKAATFPQNAAAVEAASSPVACCSCAKAKCFCSALLRVHSPRLHEFVLTDGTGSLVYGHCLRFFELSFLGKEAESKEKEKETSGNQGVCVCGEPDGVLGCVRYVERAFCVLSFFPFCLALRQWLCSTFRVYAALQQQTRCSLGDSKNELLLETRGVLLRPAALAFLKHQALAVVAEAPAPISGRLAVSLSLPQVAFRRKGVEPSCRKDGRFALFEIRRDPTDVSLRLPPPGGLPLLQLGIAADHDCSEAAASKDFSRLFLCAALAYPLVYRQVFVPLLPLSLVSFVSMPVPFVVGIQTPLANASLIPEKEASLLGGGSGGGGGGRRRGRATAAPRSSSFPGSCVYFFGKDGTGASPRAAGAVGRGGSVGGLGASAWEGAAKNLVFAVNVFADKLDVFPEGVYLLDLDAHCLSVTHKALRALAEDSVFSRALLPASLAAASQVGEASAQAAASLPRIPEALFEKLLRRLLPLVSAPAVQAAAAAAAAAAIVEANLTPQQRRQLSRHQQKQPKKLAALQQQQLLPLPDFLPPNWRAVSDAVSAQTAEALAKAAAKAADTAAVGGASGSSLRAQGLAKADPLRLCGKEGAPAAPPSQTAGSGRGSGVWSFLRLFAFLQQTPRAAESGSAASRQATAQQQTQTPMQTTSELPLQEGSSLCADDAATEPSSLPTCNLVSAESPVFCAFSQEEALKREGPDDGRLLQVEREGEDGFPGGCILNGEDALHEEATTPATAASVWRRTPWCLRSSDESPLLGRPLSAQETLFSSNKSAAATTRSASCSLGFSWKQQQRARRQTQHRERRRMPGVKTVQRRRGSCALGDGKEQTDSAASAGEKADSTTAQSSALCCWESTDGPAFNAAIAGPDEKATNKWESAEGEFATPEASGATQKHFSWHSQTNCDGWGSLSSLDVAPFDSSDEDACDGSVAEQLPAKAFQVKDTVGIQDTLAKNTKCCDGTEGRGCPSLHQCSSFKQPRLQELQSESSIDSQEYADASADSLNAKARSTQLLQASCAGQISRWVVPGWVQSGGSGIPLVENIETKQKKAQAGQERLRQHGEEAARDDFVRQIFLDFIAEILREVCTDEFSLCLRGHKADRLSKAPRSNNSQLRSGGSPDTEGGSLLDAVRSTQAFFDLTRSIQLARQHMQSNTDLLKWSTKRHFSRWRRHKESVAAKRSPFSVKVFSGTRHFGVSSTSIRCQRLRSARQKLRSHRCRTKKGAEEAVLFLKPFVLALRRVERQKVFRVEKSVEQMNIEGATMTTEATRLQVPFPDEFEYQATLKQFALRLSGCSGVIPVDSLNGRSVHAPFLFSESVETRRRGVDAALCPAWPLKVAGLNNAVTGGNCKPVSLI